MTSQMSTRTIGRRPRRGCGGAIVHSWACTVLVAAIVLCGVAVWSPPAVAAVGHAPLFELEEGFGGEPFVRPSVLAVDRASGDVFVADGGSGYVNVFDGSGTFLTRLGGGGLLAAGVAVDEASGRVYVADDALNAVLAFKPDGFGGYVLIGEWAGAALPGGQFGQVTGVAVDNSSDTTAGDVYVVDARDPVVGMGTVDLLAPRPTGPDEGLEGELVRVLSKKSMVEPNGVTVDGTGRVYVADSVRGAVLEFSSAGIYEGKLNGSSSPLGPFAGKEDAEGNVSGLAVDPTSGDLLVAEGEAGVVSELTVGGEWAGWIAGLTGEGLGGPSGVAVDGAGSVYVAEPGLGRVGVFGAGQVVADVTTERATKVSRSSVTLGGTVDGLGQPGHAFFEWGPTAALGSATPAMSFAGGQQAETATLSVLASDTTYYYRLVGEDEDGVSYGATYSFTTPAAVEGVATGPVAGLEPGGATLTGSLLPNGVEAHYYFQWGATTLYGNDSPMPPGIDAGSGKGSTNAEAKLGALSPDKLYHYRLVAQNSYGTTYGSDEQFRTSGPPQITTLPAEGIGQETATLTAELNPEQIATTYHFEYGETTAYGSEAPAGGGSVSAGAKAVSVSAALSGLKLGSVYHYRLVAVNSAGATVGPDETFTTLAAVQIATSVTDVTSTEATLGAAIDPLGHDTNYYFEYGTEPCISNSGGCRAEPVAPGQDIGGGEEPVTESLALTGLVPNTTYHYRVIAVNGLGRGESEEGAFTTGRVVLPDGRAWEMVSPPLKGAAPVEALTREGGVILASEDGDELTYLADGALGEGAQSNRTPEWQQILATRGSGEWRSQDIATPDEEAQGFEPGEPPEYQFFTPSLSSALVQPLGNPPAPPLAPEVGQETMYIRDNVTGTYVPVVSEANVAPGVKYGGRLRFLDATSDLSHVVLVSSVALEGHSSAPGLYEWSAGKLVLASVLPSGEPVRGEVELGYSHTIATALSSDGQRVIWTSPNPEAEAHLGHLYLRDMARGETIQLDAAQGVVQPKGGGVARFQMASSDGSRVFFTDSQRLTPDSSAEPLSPPRSDLYECDITIKDGRLSCQLTDLTIDPYPGEHAAVQGAVLGASESTDTLYVVAQGVLATNQSGTGEAAQSGAENLYEIHWNGSKWGTSFVAALTSADNPEWEANDVADTAYLTARVSPNGRYFAFMSAASLTGYDNADENSGARDEEVYLYDSETASLTCVSCNPTGARPFGVLDQAQTGEGLGLLVDRRKIWAEKGREHWLAGNIPGWTAQSLTTALFQSRYLNDQGRLFFNSPDSLVPAATNQKENVYEYEPSGVGSCQSATGGCVALLSSGGSSHESAFVEATPSGNDVFFVTESKLLPQDTDTAFDIYDARTCTPSSPCLSEPLPPAEPCSATQTCRPASQPVQIGGVGGSATFTGPDNQSSAPAKSQTKATKAAKRSSAKPLSPKQQLAKALKLCRERHRHSERRRKTCEARARKLYAPKHKTKPTAKRVSTRVGKP
jgi:hypothetical protein